MASVSALYPTYQPIRQPLSNTVDKRIAQEKAGAKKTHRGYAVTKGAKYGNNIGTMSYNSSHEATPMTLFSGPSLGFFSDFFQTRHGVHQLVCGKHLIQKGEVEKGARLQTVGTISVTRGLTNTLADTASLTIRAIGTWSPFFSVLPLGLGVLAETFGINKTTCYDIPDNLRAIRQAKAKLKLAKSLPLFSNPVDRAIRQGLIRMHEKQVRNMTHELTGNSLLTTARTILLGAGIAAIVTVVTAGVLFSMLTPVGWAFAGGLALYLIGSGLRMYWDARRASRKREMKTLRESTFGAPQPTRNPLHTSGSPQKTHQVQGVKKVSEAQIIHLLKNDPVFLSHYLKRVMDEENIHDYSPFWVNYFRAQGIENPTKSIQDYICVGIVS